MKKLLKFLLIVAIWLVIAAVAMGAAWALGVSLTLAAMAVVGLLVAWLMFLGVRKLVRRQRAKKRAEHLVNVERPEAGEGAGAGPGLLGWFGGGGGSSLERRLRRLNKLLAGSRLRERGEPKYVLPWYLLLGQGEAGKSELVTRAGLSVPTLDDEALHGDGNSLQWWLYNEGIIVDAPGTYVGADMDAAPDPEWWQLLHLLAKDRPREPLNGVVIPVPYERLTEDPDGLYDYGRLLRKRIDELMRAIKVQLPIYIVVTKCDQMSGFTSWCQSLGAEALAQPMGVTNEPATGGARVRPAAPFASEAVRTVSNRISELMLVVANDGGADPELLRLPLSVERLHDSLTSLVDGLFQATAFEEAPRLQGLYFTGRQKAATEARQAFARELFAKVLPANRRVLSTLSKAQRAERQARRIALSGWGVAVLVALAVIVGTWQQHNAYLERTAREHAGEFSHGGSLGERIDRLHRMRVMIDQVSSEVSTWLMPWFGAPGYQEPQFLQELRRIFHRRGREEVINPLDQRLDNALAQAQKQLQTGELSQERQAFLISALVERINLLAAFADGVDAAGLRDMPGPYYNDEVYFDGVVDPLTVERANAVYTQALVWAPERAPYRERLSRRREQLVELLEESGKRMGWLIPWANDRLPQAGFTVADFWPGTGAVEQATAVDPAFTRQGYQAIQRFLEQLNEAGIDPERFSKLRENFISEYRRQYFAEWERFAKDFGQGEQRLIGRREKLEGVNALASRRNPHFVLLDTMYENLEPFATADLPDWAAMVRFYDQMRSFSPDEEQRDTSKRNRLFAKLGLKVVKKTGPLGKSLAKSGKKGLKTQKKVDRATASSGKGPSERELRLQEAGKLLDQYRDKLEDIAFNADIRSASHAAATSMFKTPDNLGKGKGPFAQAHQKMRELKGITGVETQYNRAFWEVFTGPLDLVADFYVREAACYVQDEWEKKFLVDVNPVPLSQRPGYMFGEGGALSQFMSKNLGPFVERRPRAGYVAKRAGEWRLPLEKSFMEFATQGREAMAARDRTYKVQVEARPTSANEEAARKPSRTVLQLSCSDGDEKLVNLNFPATKVFEWNSKCSDTALKIEIGSHVLEKTWEGEHGFAKFLSEFRQGRRRYRPESFPRKESALESYGVSYIDVGFGLSGHQPVIERMNALPTKPPQTIAACWS